ncbi:MAG: hypothetical protein OJF50_006550 [Nitrospira sp.]|nr:hypothetical protein [Nitrospira sp.]
MSEDLLQGSAILLSSCADISPHQVAQNKYGIISSGSKGFRIYALSALPAFYLIR